MGDEDKEFESSVNSEYSKTIFNLPSAFNQFESSVNSEYSKTVKYAASNATGLRVV